MPALQSTEFNPRAQLLPHIIDHYAHVRPDAIYAEYPRDDATGYQPITYKAFANAINGIAGWLTAQLGPGHGEVLAYVGPNDVRYPVLVMGAIKAGYCMFMTSPRNSTLAHKSLLERLKCTTLLAPVPRPPPATAILEAKSLKALDVPSIKELLSTEYPVFKFSKTYPEAATEPLIVLHTSGSTGIPKPVIWTHETAVRQMRTQILEGPEGFEGQFSWGFSKRQYMMMPPFHAAGIAHFFLTSMHVGITLILPLPGVPTAASMVAAHKQSPFSFAMVAPSVVQELAQNPELLDYCSTHLDYIMYCGGDVPQPIGDIVASKLRLVNQYGASEIGFLNSIHSLSNRDPRTDWRYINFHPGMGVDLRHVSGEEYELVIVRNPEYETHQWAFSVFPDRQEYHTSDLMIRHPDPKKPDLWRTSARLDDVIVFLNGEKTNPVSMEQYITANNPAVTGVLVVGAQRFQAALLVELGTQALSISERAAMIEQLWPSISQANAECPAHARISKSHILFTTPDKPMLRAAKGTIQRAGTLTLYAPGLDALYADADKLSQQESDSTSHPGPGSVDDPIAVADYIRTSLLTTTNWSPDALSDTANWFSLGLDSLQTITATRTLKRGLNLPTLTPNILYLHPTITALTQALRDLHAHQTTSAEAIAQASLRERDLLLEDLLPLLASPPSTSLTPLAKPPTHTVLLTGSTGQLGTYLLSSLLANPTISHVHVLNRNPSADTTQTDRLTTYSLPPLDPSRVTFHTTDLTHPTFNLPPTTYSHLQQTATLIIHNAWTVNFNLSLPTFRPNLLALINLLNFSTLAPHTPPTFFISSISSTMNHTTATNLIPESLVTTTTPAPNGYATSKYIAEHILSHAAKQPHFPSPAFARVGQVSGPVLRPGLWNKAEWFPSLVMSSVHLGVLPETLGGAFGRVDWVPVDLLAGVLVELALSTTSTSASTSASEDKGEGERLSVYHPVNLHPQPWSAILPLVGNATGLEGKTVPAAEWVQRVRADIESVGKSGDALKEEGLAALLEKNPAAKLLEFFEWVMAQDEGECVLDTVRTAEKSALLREVEGVKQGWVEKWVGEWL
ncbi:acetyl-CoA synthetase-like protein, partial [Aspergillus ellipticus CBS 707.79]